MGILESHTRYVEPGRLSQASSKVSFPLFVPSAQLTSEKLAFEIKNINFALPSDPENVVTHFMVCNDTHNICYTTEPYKFK